MTNLRVTTGRIGREHGRLADLVPQTLAAGLVVLAIAWPTLAQKPAETFAATPELRAAMAKAETGDVGELVGLADSGRADAQYIAGEMFILGSGQVAKDRPRGCAYEEKASTSRADAMFLVGICHRYGLSGAPDLEKAKAAFTRADQMGFARARCALGDMLMAEPAQAQRGVDLCRRSAETGEIAAQLLLARVYFAGGPVTADHAEARRWWAMAVEQDSPEAARRLGEMYANGDGGPRDKKKALELWNKAEAAGDPMAAILVGDQLFSDLSGGQAPEYGQYKFRGGIPVADIDVVSDWYRAALDRDPRPDVKERARRALNILDGFKKAASASNTK